MDYVQFLSENIKQDEKEILKPTNFPRNHDVLALFPQLKYLNNVNDSDSQSEFISIIENNEDQQKYLLLSGEIGQHLKEEKYLQDMDGRLINAGLRNQLDPL